MFKMKNISLLLIKPEALKKTDQIKKFLIKRNYKIMLEENYKNWTTVMKKIYIEFPKEELNIFIQGYKKGLWKNKFKILILKNIGGNTIEKLKKDEGNFIKYQKNKENTLRAKFGLPKKYNKQFINKNRNTIFTYNGFHCPKNKEELKHHLKLFNLEVTSFNKRLTYLKLPSPVITISNFFLYSSSCSSTFSFKNPILISLL